MRTISKLVKTRPLISVFGGITNRYCKPGQNLALDESQIFYCARKVRVVHRGGKHHIKSLKNYVKSFGLHEGSMGCCLNFAIDECGHLNTKDYVCQLVSCLKMHDQQFHLVMGHYYMSVDNIRMLQAKNPDVYVTLRKDHDLPKELLLDVQAHPLENGEVRWIMAPSNLALLAVW